MKKLLSIIVFVFFVQLIFAQGTVFEEKRTIYKKEQTFGATIHTTGWGVVYRYGKYTSGFSQRIYEVELVGKKHPKEIKTFTSLFDNSNGYVYGKLNSIMILRGGIGKHATFISKQSVRGIAISYVLNAGISLAYAKPAYVKVIEVDSIEIKYPVEKYNPNKHTQGDIVGGASFFKGFFGGKFYPGAYVKAGLHFESSIVANKISGLEVGGILDVYPQKVPILANDLNRYYFFNLYVSLTFGSKKTE